MTVLANKAFKEYVDAGKDILLNGKYREDLENARIEGNKKFIGEQNGHYPSDIIVSFVLDVENKVNKAISEGKETSSLLKKYEIFEGYNREEILDLVKKLLEF